MSDVLTRYHSEGRALTINRVREMFDYNPETGDLVRRIATSPKNRIGDVVRSTSKRGYLQVQIGPRKYKLHRLAWAHFYGEWPLGLLDHINRNVADNRIANLRVATVIQNQANSGRRIDNTSGFKGVCLHKVTGKWGASLSVAGKRIHLGLFGSPELAHAAYCEAAFQYHGEFARAA